MSRLLDPSQMSSTLTAIGHRKGYLPPEALRLDDEEYDHSLDVFSLGVIMVQIVCKAETVKTTKDRSLLVSQIPTTHKLNSIIGDCLQEDKSQRPTARNIYTLIEVHFRDQEGESYEFVSGEAARSDDLLRELRPPLNLKWRRGKDMPIKMGNVYVGGGCVGNNHDGCTVMKLDLQRDEWTKLPQYNAMYFSMTSLTNRLLLVGGVDLVSPNRTNQIALFVSGRWTNPYPPMRIARQDPTVVSFRNYIIVIGGLDGQGMNTSSVEVLDVSSKRWYIADLLPKPKSQISASLIENTLYCMGGWDCTGYGTKTVHKVDLNDLIKKAVFKQAVPGLWQVIEDIPLKDSSPVCVGRSLLAVGGYDSCGIPSSSIYLYQQGAWVKVGDMPTARFNCTCSVLSSGEVIVAGGYNESSSISSAVNFLSIL